MSYKRLPASGLQRNSDSSRMRAAGKRRDDPLSNQPSKLWGQSCLPCHNPCPPCLSRSGRALCSELLGAEPITVVVSSGVIGVGDLVSVIKNFYPSDTSTLSRYYNLL